VSSLERKLDTLISLLENLSKFAEKDTPIIVEGKSDADALRRLGVKGEFICVKASLKPLHSLLEHIKGNEAVILTDFDRRGTELASRLKKMLENMRIKPNLFYWKEISGLVKHDVKDIEGLTSYIYTLRKKVGRSENHLPFL